MLDAIGVDVKIEPLCNQKIGSHACGGVKYDQTVRFNVSSLKILFFCVTSNLIILLKLNDSV